MEGPNYQTKWHLDLKFRSFPSSHLFNPRSRRNWYKILVGGEFYFVENGEPSRVSGRFLTPQTGRLRGSARRWLHPNHTSISRRGRKKQKESGVEPPHSKA
jgi:hypothetical protein